LGAADGADIAAGPLPMMWDAGASEGMKRTRVIHR
jgi:hypothetical protein